MLHLGFHDDLTHQARKELQERGFQLMEAREGTKRNIGCCCSRSKRSASPITTEKASTRPHAAWCGTRNLGWPQER